MSVVRGVGADLREMREGGIMALSRAEGAASRRENEKI